MREELLEAVQDFFYLINRGYNRKTSLDLVCSRYLLTREERLILYRSIFSQEISRIRRRKIVEINEIINGDEILVIDMFNLISTVTSALLRDVLILGTDGILRDIASTRRKVRFDEKYITALIISLISLMRVNPSGIVAVFDSQISKSAHFSMVFSSFCERMCRKYSTVLSKNADTEVIKLSHEYEAVTVSSDSVIIDKVNRIADLGGWIANILSPESIINLGELVYEKA